jgi:hypothetical protein
MEFPYLGTIVGAVLAFFLGALWYSPVLFANRWEAAMRLTRPDFKPEPKPAIFIGCAVTWIVSATMFGSLVMMTGYDGKLASLLCIATVIWLGFSLPPIVMTILFEDRNLTVSAISAGYHLVAFALMAVAHWLL